MTLGLALNTALSGLGINQQRLATIAQNIANANTEGYSRKLVNQDSIVLDGVGAGVSIESVSRKVDKYLQVAVQRQMSVTGRSEIITDYAERLQILLGSPGDSNGLNSHITNMFNAMQSLAATPGSSSNRVNTLNASKQLVAEVQNLYNNIQELRFDADQAIGTSVDIVNSKLKELHDLNTAITNATVMNRPKSELLDRRDKLAREIGEHVDVTIYTKPNDTINIYARGGATLLDLSLYELSYNQLSSIDSFTVDDLQFSAIRTYLLDAAGNRVSESTPIATGGSSGVVETAMNQGKIKGLIETRDVALPAVIEQLDMLTSRIRDEVNAIHNKGSGFPGTNSLTGTRAVTADGFSNWQGSVRLGLVDINGQPLPSSYGSESSPMRPLTMNLSTLDGGLGNGPGNPDAQAIINEINSHYGPPRNKVSLGNLNSIELASTTLELPGNFLNFDFDIENISGAGTDFFVTGVTVLDDTSADITSVTNTAPSISLDAVNTYTTVDTSNIVTVAATGHGLQSGDYVYLPTPSTGVGGVAASSLGGMFQISNITANGFEITLASGVGGASSSAMLSEAGTAIPKYQSSATGTKARTAANGGFTADISGNVSSAYYDVSARVGTIDEDGTVSFSTITYRVASNDGNMYNKRYGAISATATAVLEAPNQRIQPIATAKLVDADGNEIPKIRGRYLAGVEGFLEITTGNTTSYISIDSLDSSENGNPVAIPFAVPGSGNGFSHWFELNNFFKSNVPTGTGDTVANSARRFAIEDLILDNPGNISTGTLVQSNRPGNPNLPDFYSYERISGDSSIAQELGNLATGSIVFDQAGGLASGNQSISGYAGEILGFAGANANSALSNHQSKLTILSGFEERASAISGVNLDQELGDMVLFQQAYAGSAKIITTAKELYDILLRAT